MKILSTKLFRKWFSKLRNEKIRDVIDGRVARMASGDMGDHKYVGDYVYEARIHLKPGYRLYYTYEGDTVIILLLGGIKNPQQSRDIKKVQEIVRNRRERNGI